MTPHILRVRLLKARQDTVKQLAEELKGEAHANVDELVEVLCEEHEAIQREILQLQTEREQMAYCGVKTTA